MVDILLFTGFYTNIPTGPTGWLALGFLKHGKKTSPEAALGGELFTTYERLKLYGSGTSEFCKKTSGSRDAKSGGKVWQLEFYF